VDFHLPPIFVNLILVVLVGTNVREGIPDERAIQLDKDAVSGRLEHDAQLGWIFRGTDGEAIALRHIRRVENAAPLSIPSGTSPAHRVYLWGNESLSGVVESIDLGQIHFDMPAAHRIHIPLATVQRIVHFQGDAVVFRDDFEGDESLRKVKGQSQRSEGRAASGEWSLRFAAPGDAVEYPITDPVVSGWFESRFWDSGAVRSSVQWSCELDFESQAGIRTIQVILGANAESYALATPQGPALPVQRIARRPGWNRLAVRFSTERFTLLVNDAVLTHRAIGIGSLRSVRFQVRTAEDPEAPKAEEPEWFGFIDDVQIATSLLAAVERQPARDQDDVLLANGDQLFGAIDRANRRELTVRGEFGERRVPWIQLQEVHFTPRAAAPATIEGQRVRVEFAATATPQSATADFDVLEGTLRELSDETITLQHPFLGTVRIPRALMRSMEFASTGQLLAIDPGFHHFGEQVNVRLQVPHPGGSDRRWTFPLDDVPDQATLLLYVVDMMAMPPGSEANKRSSEDQWRTYVAINDTLVDPAGLNHLLTLNYRSPARLRVPVAKGLLKKGPNTLRIFQTPTKDDPRSFDDCGIFGIALEFGPM
jgi:hypothetical protein